MSNEPERRKCLKVCYQTRAEAKKDMKHMNKTMRRGLTDVYWCEICSYYHVTSMPKQRSRDLKRHLKNKKSRENE